MRGISRRHILESLKDPDALNVLKQSVIKTFFSTGPTRWSGACCPLLTPRPPTLHFCTKKQERSDDAIVPTSRKLSRSRSAENKKQSQRSLREKLISGRDSSVSTFC